MKTLKFTLVIGLLLSCTNIFADTSSSKVIEKIQIAAGGPDSTYYFVNSTGWGASGCPNAIYAHVVESEAGSEAMLSLALTAKAIETSVQFLGDCSADGNYFKVTYMFLE